MRLAHELLQWPLLGDVARPIGVVVCEQRVACESCEGQLCGHGEQQYGHVGACGLTFCDELWPCDEQQGDGVFEWHASFSSERGDVYEPFCERRESGQGGFYELCDGRVFSCGDVYELWHELWLGHAGIEGELAWPDGVSARALDAWLESLSISPACFAFLASYVCRIVPASPYFGVCEGRGVPGDAESSSICVPYGLDTAKHGGELGRYTLFGVSLDGVSISADEV